MRSLYTTMLCLLLAVFTFTASAQGIPSPVDADPNAVPSPSVTTQDAMWDIQFQIDVDSLTNGIGLAGAECTGLNFFAAEWGYQSNTDMFKLDLAGNVIDSMTTNFTGSTSGIRDLAWDGTYLYGGTAGTSIFCFDVNGTLITTITSPTAVRAIAYDEVQDAFWVNNFSTDLVLVSRQGVALDTISAPPSCYGMAYDNVSTGGPFLWLFSGTSSATNTCQVEQFSIATGLATGVTHSISTDFGPSIAGGLFTQENIVPGKYTLGGLMQSIVDIFGYEIGDLGSGYCAAAGGQCDEYISNVTIGNTVNNSSMCGNYEDYTSIVAPVNIGVPTSVTVTNGNPYSSDQCGIWVDWNQNQDFSDDTAVVVTGTPGVGPYTAMITPPAGTPLGQTRMRIRIMYTGTLGPCDTTTYGEVEDYTLMVSNTAQVDAGVASIIPVGPASGNHDLKVTIKNYGLDTLTSATIGYDLNGTAGATTNWTGSLAPLAESDTITLATALPFPQGNNTVTAWTSMPNGTTDGNTVNDTISWSTYLYGAISTLPYAQGFESGLGNWQQATGDEFDWLPNSGPTTSLTTGPSAAQEGTIYMYTESSSPRVVGDEAMLDCMFDFTSYANVTMSFWYHMYGASIGTLHVDVYADSMWHTDVWSLTGNQTDMWFEALVPLDSVAGGHDDVIIRFRGTMADDGTGIVYWGDMAIDNINLYEPQGSDIGILNLVAPVDGWFTGTDTVKATIRNFGGSPATNFVVGFQVDTNAPVLETVTATVPAGGDMVYTFAATADLSIAGNTYDVSVWTALTGDQNPANDTLLVPVTNTYGIPCAASGGGDEFISNVTAGTINNTTAFNSGYDDYTNLYTVVPQDGSVQVSVTNGNPYVDDHCGIWVDWNRNGLFTDDAPVTVNGTPGGGPYTATIVPPVNVDTGFVRMRVRIRYNAVPEPCGTTTYGEVEDYSIYVDLATGIQDVVNDKIDVYPNPSTGVITILGAENSEINIYNVVGSRVYTNLRFTGRHLDLSSLPAGTYFMHVLKANRVITKKVVISR